MKYIKQIFVFTLSVILLLSLQGINAAAVETQTQFTVNLYERTSTELPKALAQQICDNNFVLGGNPAGTVFYVDLDGDGTADVNVTDDDDKGVYAISVSDNADRTKDNTVQYFDSECEYSPVIFIFSELKNCTVSFVTNYGTAPKSQTVEQFNCAEEPEEPSCEEYDFDGWYEDDEFDIPYFFTELVEDDITLYAKWVDENGVAVDVDDTGDEDESEDVKTFTLTFDANGGEGSMEEDCGEYDTSEYLPPNDFTKNGYYFVSWNTKADGSGQTMYDMDSVSDIEAEDGDSITLYAQWKIIYNVIEGANAKTFRSAEQGITFRIDGDYNKFTGIKIDSRNVAPSDYNSWEGSTYVELPPEYTDSLARGWHRIEFLFTDGKAETLFLVKESEDDPDEDYEFVYPSDAKGLVTLDGAVINKETDVEKTEEAETSTVKSDETTTVTTENETETQAESETASLLTETDKTPTSPKTGAQYKLPFLAVPIAAAGLILIKKRKRA